MKEVYVTKEVKDLFYEALLMVLNLKIKHLN